MKTSPALLVALAAFAIAPDCVGQLAYDHDVYRGSLTPISDDGFWRKYATEFPVIGGWMELNSTNNAGNGPEGSIWVHQEGDGWAHNWGAYDTPITVEQFDDPSLITRTWSWGIYYVYGQNKILEYGAFGYPYPPGAVSYTISYSAGVVPEPPSSLLVALGLVGLFGFARIRGKCHRSPLEQKDQRWQECQKGRTRAKDCRGVGCAHDN